MRLSGLSLLLAAPLLLAPAPAHADIDQDVACIELENSGTEDRYQTSAASLPLESLGVARAHDLLTGPGLPGSGVKVAVIDSGVDPTNPLLDVEQGPSFANKRELLDYHGTAVAGLVAGKPRGDELTGVAPGATIVDVRVYDDDDASQEEGSAPVETDRVIEGIDWVARNARSRGIGVAVVALRVSRPEDRPDRLQAAIRRLHRADVVVVAASGNRPTEDADPLTATYGELAPGEDARDVVFPAGYADDVLAVNATIGGHPDEAGGGDARSFVLQNSATDLAAPTYNAVSLGLNGSTCLLQDVATSWAAAEVAGVAALLRAEYDDESADQIVARLTGSASGAAEDRNVLLGAGLVQPAEAISRPLTPTGRGDLDRLPAEERDLPPAAAPEPEADLLADARESAVWFGLLGGGAVVLALLLRPILARRRG